MTTEAYLRELHQINGRFHAAQVKAHEDRTTAIIQLVEKAVKTDSTPEPAPVEPAGEVQS